mmetsp:Transcript_8900/g.14462  ORF Transcript_8900/g.14462 Transcript_8900/m.14462 type:complete len:248 (+) Transcript_8900:204-947(+)
MRPLFLRRNRTPPGTGKARSSNNARPTSSPELRDTRRPTISRTLSSIAAILYMRELYVLLCVSRASHAIPTCSIHARTTATGISKLQKFSDSDCASRRWSKADINGMARKSCGQLVTQRACKAESMAAAFVSINNGSDGKSRDPMPILYRAANSVVEASCLSSGSVNHCAIRGSAKEHRGSHPIRNSAPVNSLTSGDMQSRFGSANQRPRHCNCLIGNPRGSDGGNGKQTASNGASVTQSASLPLIA